MEAAALDRETVRRAVRDRGPEAAEELVDFRESKPSTAVIGSEPLPGPPAVLREPRLALARRLAPKRLQPSRDFECQGLVRLAARRIPAELSRSLDVPADSLPRPPSRSLNCCSRLSAMTSGVKFSRA